MITIEVNIGWNHKNYCASVDNQIPGAIVVTEKDFDKIKTAVAESVLFHIEGMIADGETVPKWLIDGDYQFKWHLNTSALLQRCEQYTSMAAIARVTGINKHLLSHYANNLKTPSKKQHDRIVEGIHKIGRELLLVE